jgi:hypothetical protein
VIPIPPILADVKLPLIGVTHDAEVLAKLAKGRLRAKLPALHEALAGRLRTEHHGVLLARSWRTEPPLSQRLVDGGKLGLRQARGRPGGAAACQRVQPALPPLGVSAAGVLPGDIQLAGNLGLGAASGKTAPGLHADVFERLAVVLAAGLAAVGGWSHACGVPERLSWVLSCKFARGVAGPR